MKKLIKETVIVDDKGRVTLSPWLWKALLADAKSKAKSVGGQRKAIKKRFVYLLRKGIEEMDKKSTCFLELAKSKKKLSTKNK